MRNPMASLKTLFASDAETTPEDDTESSSEPSTHTTQRYVIQGGYNVRAEANSQAVADDWAQAAESNGFEVTDAEAGAWLPSVNVREPMNKLKSAIEAELKAAARSGYEEYSPTGRMQCIDIQNKPWYAMRQLLKEHQTQVPHPHHLEVHTADGPVHRRQHRRLKNADVIERGLDAYETYRSHRALYGGLSYIRIIVETTPRSPSLSAMRNDLGKLTASEDNRIKGSINQNETTYTKLQVVRAEVREAAETIEAAYDEIWDNPTTEGDPYYSSATDSKQYEDIEV